MARRTRWRWAFIATVAVFGSMLSACSDDASPPTRLIDGSRARTSQIVFEDVELPVLMTVARRGRTKPRCESAEAATDAIVVERVGVAGASVTAHSTRTRTLRACDRTAATWCGHAFARLQQGRPLDPRLSLTCEDSDGNPVGFAWIEPAPKTRYVVVTHAGYAEAYEVLAGTPVRVTTDDVDVTTSTARLDVSEHAVDGRRLGAYRVVAQVAG